jgi:hypothetical protein
MTTGYPSAGNCDQDDLNSRWKTTLKVGSLGHAMLKTKISVIKLHTTVVQGQDTVLEMKAYQL